MKRFAEIQRSPTLAGIVIVFVAPLVASLVASLVMATALVGCGPMTTTVRSAEPIAQPAPAPPPPRRRRAPGAILVHNGTVDVLTIRIDGRPVATLHPDEVFRSGPLAPGPHELVADAPSGAVQHHARLGVRPGETTRWDMAQRYGALLVVNHTRVAAIVRVVGRELAPIPPGGERRFARVPAGVREVIARTVSGTPIAKRTERFQPDVTVRIVLQAPPRRLPPHIIPPPPAPVRMGAVEVRNETNAPLSLWLGERRLGEVPAGRTLRFDRIRAGRHRLEARVAGTPPHVRELVIAPGAVARWTIEPRPARLSVENAWSVPAIIMFDGRRLGRVPARGAAVFDQLRPGRHRIRAERSGGPPSVVDLVLREGRATGWQIKPDALSSLRVVNRSRTPIRLTVAGREEGTLGPRSERVIRRLSTARIRVVATARSGARDARTIDLSPGRVSVWEVSLTRPAPPATARLHVSNLTRVRITITVGGSKVGTVSPGAEVMFEGLRPGRVVVVARSPRGHELGRTTLKLPAGGERRWRVRRR